MPLRTRCLLTIGVLIGLAIFYGCSQSATEAQGPVLPRPPLEYIGQWGVKGGGPGQLADPVSIATDSLGNVYIADAGSQFIHKFDWQGTPRLSLQEDALRHPQWIAVDSDGVVYVSDPVRGSIFVIYPGGERDIHRELRLRTRPGKEGFVSVAAGTDDLIYVLNSAAGKVDAYSPRFRLVRSWAPSTGLSDSGDRFGPIVMGSDGNLYIVDQRGSGILRFSDAGQFLSEVKLSVAGARLSSQFAVSRTCIFAMDADGRMLHVWTIDGRPKLDLDLAPQLGQAFRPAPALAVSGRGELLVLDQPEARVLRYRMNF
jgi:hypothetical protein